MREVEGSETKSGKWAASNCNEKTSCSTSTRARCIATHASRSARAEVHWRARRKPRERARARLTRLQAARAGTRTQRNTVQRASPAAKEAFQRHLDRRGSIKSVALPRARRQGRKQAIATSWRPQQKIAPGPAKATRADSNRQNKGSPRSNLTHTSCAKLGAAKPRGAHANF